MAEMQRDLTRSALAILFLAILISLSFWILHPFLGAVVWATMIVVATWPIMIGVQRRLWGRRALAVTVMTLLLLLVLIAPLSLAIGTIVANAGAIGDFAKSLANFKMPPPPSWLSKLPLVGQKAVLGWKEIAAAGIEGLAAKAAPYAGSVTTWFVTKVGSFGMVFVQFLLTVMIAAILYAKGERAAVGVTRFARRLAGKHGEDSVRLAGQAIRGVALGVVVTALAQSIVGGIGLALAGVPFAAILTALMFLLAVAQVGATLVLVPAVIWLYWNGATGWGTFLLVWTVAVGALDHFLRPILIKKGADLPLLLIFAGVIGGLLAFGLIGIFLGPLVLAVSYTLLQAWVSEEPDAA